MLAEDVAPSLAGKQISTQHGLVTLHGSVFLAEALPALPHFESPVDTCKNLVEQVIFKSADDLVQPAWLVLDVTL